MNFDHDLPRRTPADSEQRESHPSFQTIIGTDTSRTKKRVATKIPKKQREARISDKKITSKTKQLRQKLPLDY